MFYSELSILSSSYTTALSNFIPIENLLTPFDTNSCNLSRSKAPILASKDISMLSLKEKIYFISFNNLPIYLGDTFFDIPPPMYID